jgi:4-hydroxythreonine-4-phosphate dehydrogenase
MKPTIGVLLGDPCGVGPELVAKLLAEPDLGERANVVVIGDLRVFRMGEAAAGLSVPLHVIDDIGDADFQGGATVFVDFPTIDPSEVTPGRATAAGGRSVYETLKEAIRLARDGAIDGFCFAPYNKYALTLGGAPTGDEHILFAQELGYDGPRCELNVLGDLWTTRVTSHVPIKEVAEKITTERVLLMPRLASDTLAAAGVETPRVAVCALNPHAGDGGLFGREEIDVIAPAVERAKAEGISADGPFPSDTVFLKARDGDYDAVVTMYHDQGQIAMKLMGFGRGVTVSGGLPIPITTPASGTAFDIVGRGIATVEGTRQAFLLVCRLAESRGAGAKTHTPATAGR